MSTNEAVQASIGERKLADTSALARRYAISPRQVQKFVESGVFPTVRMGRRCLRFDVQKCDEALSRFEVRAAATGRRARKAMTEEGRA